MFMMLGKIFSYYILGEGAYLQGILVNHTWLSKHLICPEESSVSAHASQFGVWILNISCKNENTGICNFMNIHDISLTFWS